MFLQQKRWSGRTRIESKGVCGSCEEIWGQDRGEFRKHWLPSDIFINAEDCNSFQ